VPYGTRNHLARDLGLNRDDPVAAIDAFWGEERKIDVGRVGGRRFLNNARWVSTLGLSTAVSTTGAAARCLRALWLGLRRRRGVWATLDGDPVHARVVLVANNSYELDLFSLGERERLDEGLLHLYTARGWLPNA